MSDWSWLAAVEELSPAALTVRAQALPVNDQGRQFLYPIFMPRVDVSSIRIRDMQTLDDRPVADRRAWNGRGRLIPLQTPAIREMELVPIESRDKIEEKEQQFLIEAVLAATNPGTAARLVRDNIAATLPQRVDRLVAANYRRIEADAMTAWALGRVDVKNPENGRVKNVSFGFDAARYQTAGTAWNDVGRNAYQDFMDWYRSARNNVGAGRGVVLRTATLTAILEDAPTLNSGTVRMTQAQVADYIRQSLGEAFAFFEVEDTADFFDDGGIAKTRSSYWPAQRVAFVPARTQVGRTVFAPVIRAAQLAAQVPEARIDVRGMAVYYDEHATGRELDLEAQVNSMPVPDESFMWVIDAGV